MRNEGEDQAVDGIEAHLLRERREPFFLEGLDLALQHLALALDLRELRLHDIYFHTDSPGDIPCRRVHAHWDLDGL